jgi:hypothetical protein
MNMIGSHISFVSVAMEQFIATIYPLSIWKRFHSYRMNIAVSEKNCQ